MYNNPCLAQCEGASIIFECGQSDLGACGIKCRTQGKPYQCTCDLSFKPVCARSGQVYANACLTEVI